MNVAFPCVAAVVDSSSLTLSSLERIYRIASTPASPKTATRQTSFSSWEHRSRCIQCGTSLSPLPASLIPRKVPPSVPRVLINNQLVGLFRDDESTLHLLLISSYNNLPLIGDCQTLALTLIELCGWRSDYEALLKEYRSHHSSDFLWKDTYNFDTIEHNLQSFEDELHGRRQRASSPSMAVEMEDGSVVDWH